MAIHMFDEQQVVNWSISSGEAETNRPVLPGHSLERGLDLLEMHEGSIEGLHEFVRASANER